MSDGSYFISYSTADAADFAGRLAADLTGGSPAYRVWIDTQHLKPARPWDDQVTEAIRNCEAMLFVITADSVSPSSVCLRELRKAETYKRPVIPLRLHDRAAAPEPLLLAYVQDINFGHDYEAGLARLRGYLDWMGTDEGHLQRLEVLLAQAQYTLRREPRDRRAAVADDIADLERRIQALRTLISDPGKASDQTLRRIESGLDRVRQPRRTGQRGLIEPSRIRFVNSAPLVAPEYFQGRAAETGQLATALRTERIRMVTVSGRGGVGKTALACRLLRAVQSRTPLPEAGPLEVDGVVYLSPRGGRLLDFPSLFHDLCKLLPADASSKLNQLFGAPRQTPSTLMLALLRHFTRGTAPGSPDATGGPNVVLLDNFEDVIDPGSGDIKDAVLGEAIQALLAAPDHTVKLIVTTREMPRGLALFQPQAQQHIPLDAGLGSPFAEAVLRACDHDGSLGLKDAPQQQLTLAKERTRGFPRALEALAAILSADRNTRLPELLQDTWPLPENVVYALVGEAYARLDSLSQEVIQALAVFPQPVPPVAVDFLLAPYRREIDAAPVLSRLANMLFVYAEAGHYSLHQVDRDFALSQLTSRADPAPPRDAPRPSPPAGRLLDRLRRKPANAGGGTRRPGLALPGLRERAAEYFRSVRTPRDTWRTWEDLWPQLAEFELRLQNDDIDEAVSILQSIDFDYLINWGHYVTTLEMYRSVEGKISDKRMLARAHNNMGNCYSSMGKMPAAVEHYETARRIAREIQERLIEGDSLGNLGICSLNEGKLEEAERRFAEAIVIHREVGARESEATALFYLAQCLLTRGRLTEGMDRCGEALDLARTIGYHTLEAAALNSLGDCHQTLGATDLATDMYNQALQISARAGARPVEASAMHRLGSAASLCGRHQEAAAHFEKALRIYREIDDAAGEAGVLGSLGEGELAMGQAAAAMDRYEQALATAVDVGQRGLEAALLGSIGTAHIVMGRTTVALGRHERALGIYTEIGDAAGQAAALGNIGNCDLMMGRTARALERYQQALAIAESVGLRQIQANLHAGIGKVHITMGQTSAAADRYERALGIYTEIGDVAGRAGVLGSLGDCELATGRATAALDRYEQALAAAVEIGQRGLEADLRGSTGNAHIALGRIALALDCYERALGIYTEIGDAAGQAAALGNIGNGELTTGRTSRALEHYDQALAIAESAGLRQVQANLHCGIGNVRLTMGRIALALDCYERALGIYTEIGDAAGQAAVLGNIGNGELIAGRTGPALDRYDQALAIAESAGLRQVQASLHCGIGNAHLTMGQAQAAADRYERGLGLYREIGDEAGRAAALSSIGNCHALAGRAAAALECYDQALALATQFGLRQVEAAALCGRALAQADQGFTRRALENAARAAGISKQMDSVQERMQAQLALATIHLLDGEAGPAVTVAEQAAEIPFPPARPMALVLCGVANVRNGRRPAASANFRAAIDAAGELLAIDQSNCPARQAWALAYSGLALAGEAAALKARDGFESLLALTNDAGLITRTLALLDVLTAAGDHTILSDARQLLTATLHLDPES